MTVPKPDAACLSENAPPALEPRSVPDPACTATFRLPAHLQAPTEQRGLLIEPARALVPQAVACNRERRLGAAGERFDLFGRAWREIAAEARRDLLSAAVAWSRDYRDDLPEVSADAPLLVAGHQPELFHPGVWAKNFALAGFAADVGGTPLNLVIDGDTVKLAAIKVPTLLQGRPAFGRVPFDAATDELPAEDRPILDRAVWDAFPAAVAAEIAPFGLAPLLPDWWPDVREQADATGNLGSALARGRHRLEGRWGLRTLEVPLSATCGFPSFGWFAAHLLTRLPQFSALHNAALTEYRRTYRVRSRNHPFPDLAEAGEWLEAPFWVRPPHDPRRRRLFVAGRCDHLLLTDRAGWEFRWDVAADSSAEQVRTRFADLLAAGVRIRPRALTTTLWARLFLSDLFVHGLGGAKYDRLTDRIIERFYGVPAPLFSTVTATLRLPLGSATASAADVAAVERDLRELDWNPDRHLPDPAAEPAALEKARRIVEPFAPEEGRARFLAIRAANAALQPAVQVRRDRLLARRAELLEALPASRVIASREFAFCLHDDLTLREFLLPLSQKQG